MPQNINMLKISQLDFTLSESTIAIVELDEILFPLANIYTS